MSCDTSSVARNSFCSAFRGLASFLWPSRGAINSRGLEQLLHVFTGLQVPAESIVFFDATVLLGTEGVNQSQAPLRLVGYEVDRVKYWIATNRYELTGEQIAQAYKLRWNIENFFAWWKRHLKLYHLIARSAYGLMVQILAGLITYLLLAIYCHQNFQEKVSIRRVRQLRTAIENELRWLPDDDENLQYVKEQELQPVDAKPNRKLLG